MRVLGLTEQLKPSELPALLGKDDPVILDIGCNDGEHTTQFLKWFPESRVYAFEPDARARSRYDKSVFSFRATLFDIALGSKDGEAEFYPSNGFPTQEWRDHIPAGWDKSGSLRKPLEHLAMFPWCKFDPPVKVKVKRLDTWASEHGIDHIDLIWADVQGAEADLIEGGREALRRTRYFYTEYANEELYEGEIGLAQICDLLPCFEIMAIYRGGNALFKNKEMKDG